MSSFNKYFSAVLLFLWILIQSNSIIQSIHLIQHKKRELQKKENYKVIINKNEWNSIKQISKNEVEINGKMFDVKSITLINNKLILLGHFDEHEDYLISQQKTTKEKVIKQSTLFVFLFYQNIESISLFKEKIVVSRIPLKYKETTLMNVMNKDIPPPKV